MNEKEIRIMFDYVKVGIVIFILITCFFPFEKVFAELSYTVVPLTSTQVGNNSDNYWYVVNGQTEVRAVILYNGTNNRLTFASKTQNTQVYYHYGSIGGTLTIDTYCGTENGANVYCKIPSSGTAINGITSVLVPIIGRQNGSFTTDNVFKYTYGDSQGSLSPVYGDLLVSYYTDIAGSGDSSGNNVDNIQWQLWDINGQYIGDDKQIEIRAVPGHFVASDKPSLLQETFNNWVRESNLEVQVFKGSSTLQHKSFSWDYIAGLFSSIKTWSGRFWSIFASDNYWYQYGWIYEIRLLDENDEPLTQWQEIYTGTGSKPNNTNTIENSDNLTPELVNTIEDINSENNVTVNWYINNITINMAPEETTDKPWWSYLLDAILELIRTIAYLIGNLVDSLLGLFRFTTFEIPDWETKKTTIINNTGYFGQSILFVEDLKTTVQSASYVDPVLTYPGIQLDGVQLIPEVSVNLNDYVTSLGLTNFRSIAYTCTDGMIYLSLLILVIKKLEDLLSK